MCKAEDKLIMKILSVLKNEEGSALIVALLLLMLLTLIGIAATTTTTTDMQIAGNEKSYKTAFYNADAGVYTTPKLISTAIDDGANPSVPFGSTITFLDDTGSPTDTSNAFFRELMGFKDDGHDDAKDISFALGGNNVKVDVERDRTETLVGGGDEFGAGAEGAGVGSTAGTAIYYNLDSFGSGPNNSESNVGATYRKVVATAGGL